MRPPSKNSITDTGTNHLSAGGVNTRLSFFRLFFFLVPFFGNQQFHSGITLLFSDDLFMSLKREVSKSLADLQVTVKRLALGE